MRALVAAPLVLAAGLVTAAFIARLRLRSFRVGTRRDAPGSGGRRGLRRFLRPYRAPLGLATALVLLETGLGLASPWPLKVVVDNAIGGHPLPPWLRGLDALSPAALSAAAAVAGVVLVGASALVGYLASYLTGAAAERVGADLRVEAFEWLQRLSMSFHDRSRSGDLVNRLTGDVSRVQDALVAWFETLVPEALTLAGMLVVLLVLDVPMALGAVAVIPTLACFVAISRPRIKAAQREARNRSGHLATLATEVLRNVRAVQAFSRERQESERFRQKSDSAAEASIEAMDASARFSPVSDVVLATGTGFVLWLGTLQVTRGRMTLGTLLVVLAYLSSLYSPIRSLSRLSATLARGAASRERLEEVLGQDAVVAEDRDPIPPPLDPCSLELRGVHFSYRPGEAVLHGVSIRIEAGQTVCVVGPTGAGKSTLLSLIVRFYDPVAGRIEIAGIDTRRMAVHAVRDRVALVPQEPWILDGTIAENVAFGRADATRDQVERAGRLALVDEFAGRMPRGYDSEVGEGGSLLSGGQRRRLAVARALVRDAQVLLLDEPTSGLDAGSEARVLEAIQRAGAGRAVLIVSHRLGVAATADRVVVLDGGRVVEEGPPGALLASGGHFARLWALQTGAGPVGGSTGNGHRSVPREMAVPSASERR